MKRHRSSFMLLTLSLTVALCALPGSALAGPLLSGYGGPGGGTQALLGSTLVNGSGPSGGSSGGSGSARGGSASGAGAPAQGGFGGSTASGGGAGSLGGSTSSPGGARGNGSSASGPGGAGAAAKSSGNGGSAKRADGASGTSAGGSAAYTSTEGPRPVAGTAAARDAQAAPLDFTGTDALLLVFVLGVLTITMLLTRGLARTQQNFQN
jgi:hypothetical protein